MTEKKQWKRPQDVVTFRTSDPKEMLGKYMPRAKAVAQGHRQTTAP
jgi:hypothetical protein